ncbi:helix-turn-helix transcriptional regulator [Altericroceibacterium endophyticum]|uniref:Helix-turn-helix domain-containing protein n=1 Tax=Altericroceibacterium endophyticum TaxID=1808508 RepID=A0A6I4T9H4_9SPHN|nr:AraC family transcriptional regulator [Altericroceibacterium endophyticum]MXO66653.1 helix-turn-helix domain-containing protein [Altericroceibacterium endophyticum]
MERARFHEDSSWSSSGLSQRAAIREWQDWAACTIAPIDVRVFEQQHFQARWESQALGHLQMLHMHAPAQRVVHCGQDGSAGQAPPTIQLIYTRKGALDTHMNGRRFAIQPGQFVLLDNTRFYQMEMQTPHDVVDLMMPQGWLDRYLPDPGELLGRPIDAHTGWGSPLGALLETMLAGMDRSPLPRAMIADQLGTLLTLASGIQKLPPSYQRHQLAQEILNRIKRDFRDTELSCSGMAHDLGISQRSLQALLAQQGTSFTQELNTTRLENAAEILTEQHGQNLPISDIAFRCGFLDPGYFTRQFRKRFGVTPSRWRMGGTA